MNWIVSSRWITLVVIATQLFGPAALWAGEQRGIRVEVTRPSVTVAALNGDQLTLQGEQGTKALQFHQVLAEGARVSTGTGTTAELLIGNRAVVTLGDGTTAHVSRVSADQTTIQLAKGTVRVAAAASAVGPQGLVTVQTPTSQVQMRGGIVRVTVDAPVGKASDHLNGAQAYRASYSPEPLVAVATQASDLIHVEEGTAEIPGVGPTGGLLTMKAGQRVTVQAGRAGSVAEAVTPGGVPTGVWATTGHTLTPKEGRDYLVALQVDQATQLGKALTGAAETGQKESEKKDDTRNVINGATGGVTLASNTSLVNALFGTGTAADPRASSPLNTTGNGYGGTNNDANFGESPNITSRIFLNNPNALLTFTRKDPVDDPDASSLFKSLDSIASNFLVRKELVLVGGTPNDGHGGIAPTERLVIRGLATEGLESRPTAVSNNNFQPTDRAPAGPGISEKIVAANNTFLVGSKNNFSKPGTIIVNGQEVPTKVGGTLGQYSGDKDKWGLAFTIRFDNVFHSLVEGAITATTALDRPNITLSGGVALDQGTVATIGTTNATHNYFDPRLNPDLNKLKDEDARFSGSLLSVIKRPDSTPTVVLRMEDRMLGVYDGSTVVGGDPTCREQICNKALLSVLDAKLKGPSSGIPLIDIAAGIHADRKYVFDGKGNIVLKPDGSLTFDDIQTRCVSPQCIPNVTVTSALVTRSTSQLDRNPLDNKLLEASAPLFALTQATMTTTSHFADLAGNQAQSLNLNGALVALSASKLVIDSGHLLNLNNATAAITGYLFSLNNGSTLQLTNGSLFSLTNNSSLTLTGNAFGVFGSGPNTLSIQNHLCGAGSACGFLVDSAGQKVTQDGTALKVAGVTQNVALPNGFNLFALTQPTNKPSITIGTDAALFKVDSTSHLALTVK